MTVCEPVCGKRVALFPLFLMVLTAVAAVPPEASDRTAVPVLTNAQQVLDLGLDLVRRSSHPARLRGVVTFPMEGSALVYIQDATAGIQISYTNLDSSLQAGQFVEVN